MGAWSLSRGSLGWLDGAALLLACAALAWLCRRAGPARETAEDAFLASREASWWSAGLTLLASEISALTLVAVPASAFMGGWGLGQYFLGSLVGRALSGKLLGRLREGRPLTVFSWLSARLGAPAGKTAALLFCAAWVPASALRLASAALALGVMTGLGSSWCVLLLAAAAALYMGRGGLRAALAAGVYQALLCAAVTLAVVVYLLLQTPGHIHGALRLADEGGRLAYPSSLGGFAAALLHGLVGALAGFTADYQFSQKLLACRDRTEARGALAVSVIGSAVSLAALLGLGTCLYAFYRAHPALAVPDRVDLIVPHFAATVLPPGLRGLFAAALVLAAVDLPVNALSAVAWCDLGPGRADLPKTARWSLAAGVAALLAGLALVLVAQGDGPIASACAAAWPAIAGPLLAAVLAGALRPSRGWVPAGVIAAGLGIAGWLARGGYDAGWVTMAGFIAAGAALAGLSGARD